MYRILVCDDERDIVNALKIYLEAEGHEVVTAHTGAEALAAYGIYIGVNPDDALEKTDKKFRERFSYVEQRAREQGKGVQHLSLDEMIAYWKEAKTN